MKRALCAGLALWMLASCASTGKKKISDAELSDLYVELASSSLQEGDPIGALQSLEEAEKLNPRNAKVYYIRSMAFLARKDNEKALFFSRKAHELEPNNSEFLNALGKIYFDLGKYRDAEPLLTKASADPIFRGAFKSLTILGMIQLKRGDDAKAEHYFDRAIAESPSGACVAYYYRGNLKMNQSRFETAIRDYEKAIRGACANFPEAHFAIGVAYSRTSKYDKARKKFLEVKDLYPDSAVANQALERLRYLP